MAESYLLDKLRSVEQTFHELTRKLGDPDIARDASEMQRIGKARAALETVVETFDKWKQTQEDLVGAREIVKESGNDLELQAMATLEAGELEEQSAELERQLKVLLLPKDPNDDRNIMLEIRAGTGGDEAGISNMIFLSSLGSFGSSKTFSWRSSSSLCCSSSPA